MKALKNWRLWVLSLVAITGFILLVSEPTIEGDWLYGFIIPKALGICLMLLFGHLLAMWSDHFHNILEEDQNERF